ncbi:MAG: hypothetical protein IK076_09060, partial [Bacteroidales bacterium]|nr:hypothetical protein [Bacteroidales bacterium]
MASAHNHRTLAFLLSIVSLAFISCGHGARKETVETGPGVNDRIQTRIGGMAMSEPHEALALIDSAEKAGVLSSFQAQRRRAMIYFNPLQEDLKVIECAKDALETAPGKVSDHERIQLLRLMSNSYYFLGEYDSCIERAREGEQIAVSIDSLAAEGEFKFIIGECMLRLGQIAKGYANMEYGLAALSRVDGYSARTTLSHLLGEEMNFMIIDSKFDDAIKTGQRREAILEELRSEHGTDDYLDQQFGYLYGKMAYLHAETGDMAKAEDYAGKFLETKYSKDSNGRLRIMEYYLASNQPQKALELFSGTDFPSPGDTLSSDGGYYLRLKARACNALGDYKNAFSLLDRAYAISDSLD